MNDLALAGWVNAVSNITAMGLLAYLAIRGIPAALRQLGKQRTADTEADRQGRREIRESFLHALEATRQSQERQHAEHLEVARRLVRLLGQRLQTGPPDESPREED